MEEMRKAAMLVKKAQKTNQPLIVYDVETEGLNPKTHGIIQLSAVKINPTTFAVIDEYNTLINPGRPLEEKITEITGYTDEDLVGAPIELEVFPEIRDFFGKQPIVIGHSVSFDNRMLQAMFLRNFGAIEMESIDTCQMARELLKRGATVKDHKLKSVAEYYGVTHGLTFHRSNDDIIATLRIFKAMYKNQTILELEESKIIPKIQAISYFQGFRGHQRVYFYTNKGAIYWDALDKTFGAKEKDIDISRFDIETMVSAQCHKWHCEDVEELLRKLRESHYARQQKFVGTKKAYKNKEEALAGAKNCTKNHFDVKIIEEDGKYFIELVKFYKSSKVGKIL